MIASGRATSDDESRGRGARGLDFVVIGVQKGGTTSLWRYLLHHPAIAMPERKEEPFFCTEHAGRPGALSAFVDTHFRDAPPGALLGKATPQYMMGQQDVDVEAIAQRIRDEVPDVRLIALLRDPIERAISHYRMSVRRELERRSFDAAVEELLGDEQLAAARRLPTETNSYLAQGEYGRILSIYRRLFPAPQLHVELTEDLDRDPGAVIDGVLEFLGLPGGYRPPRLEVRYHRGGSTRMVDEDAQDVLFEFMAERVWPRLGSDAEHVAGLFAAFYETWNVAPDRHPLTIEASTRARLEAHFRRDAEVLAELGVRAPWLESWDAGRGRVEARRPGPGAR